MRLKKDRSVDKKLFIFIKKPNLHLCKNEQTHFCEKKNQDSVSGLHVSSDEQFNSGLNRSLWCRLKIVRHYNRNGSMSENFYLREKRTEIFSGWFVMK